MYSIFEGYIARNSTTIVNFLLNVGAFTLVVSFLHDPSASINHNYVAE